MSLKLKGLLIALTDSRRHSSVHGLTNNYGIRLLCRGIPGGLGDFVFIFDPFIWLIFGGAGFL